MNDEYQPPVPSKSLITLTVTLFAISLMANAVLIWKLVQSNPKTALESTSADVVKEEATELPEDIALSAELKLMKQMLGQWDSELFVIGPIGDEILLRGRMVWDRDQQLGFISLRGLETADAKITYTVEAENERGQVVQLFDYVSGGSSRLERAFKPSQRMLLIKRVLVTGRDSAGEIQSQAAGQPFMP
ncbi:MAG: hypothetical protein AAFY98_09380 [Verrucomicrobiota bacterium]